MSDSKLEKCFSVKLTIEDYDFLVNLASARKMEVSSIVREFIQQMKSDENKLEEEIRFYEYHVTTAKARLTDIRNQKDRGINPVTKEEDFLEISRTEVNRIFTLVLKTFESSFRENTAAKILEIQAPAKILVENEIAKLGPQQQTLIRERLHIKFKKMYNLII